MNHAAVNRVLNWLPTITNYRGKWAFNDTDGNPWPTMYDTKREAISVAVKHRDAVLDRLLEEDQR